MTRVFFVILSSLALCLAAEPARELSHKELHQLLGKAATPADHLRLAAHFEATAKRFEVEAAEHAATAKSYREHPTASEVKHPMAPDTANHCNLLSENLKKAAANARDLAAAHRRMAQ